MAKLLCLAVLLATAAAKNQSIYPALYPKHSNSTPVFLNDTHSNPNPLIIALNGHDINGSTSSGSTTNTSTLQGRQNSSPSGTGTCAPGTPCSNGACCSKTGYCGYGPNYCGSSVCISNCNAQAECGQYAPPGNGTCPLEVCCSQYGFCGTTADFCGTGCQSGYGECGAVHEPSCGGTTISRTIGYYESWSSTRPCDGYTPEQLDLSGFTHVNFAFVYFNPTTFQIAQMNAGDNNLYGRFTALKSKYPGLQTWVSIGGWSFNDADNSPNSQTAFSDMVSTQANRKAFISSLTNFMQTYGFDGVDIDWEYPGAPDRGGVPADGKNFVQLLSEMRGTWGSNYGISCTIPSSYWYMRWFDIVGMQQYIDWFNFMSYDIHGVWDSTNKFTGPYLRPSTNLTEIRLGLDLLWRNNIDPSKVTLGLAWYGRSFTLSDPSCNTPNGVCQFSSGANAGPCTGTSGILSNAEIQQILQQTGATPSFDSTAAVKWITWNSNQWVSYDDGQTISLKKQAANNLCLGGLMVWALDMDDASGTSAGALLGGGTSNGLTQAQTQQLKQLSSKAISQATNLNTCYWTFCGGKCAKGYFDTTQARGQINGVNYQEVCKSDGDVETLCCASGTTMGDCVWQGWNGVGMSCNSSDSCFTNQVAIAFNTNNYYSQKREKIVVDETCNGGFQSYCCSGFKPSPKRSASSLDLIGSNGQQTHPGINKVKYIFEAIGCGIAGALTGIAGLFGSGGNVVVGGGLGVGVTGICLKKAQEAAMYKAVGVIAGVNVNYGGIMNPQPRPPPVAPMIQPPPVKGTQKVFGQWTSQVYDPNVDPDCSVTYTCKYGRGFDEICDNQRWAITSANAGNTVYHYAERLADNGYAKGQWSNYRKSWYAKAAQTAVNRVARCQVDEFPLGSMWEGRNEALIGSQVCRLVNGPANGAQGRDWQQWLSAYWKPCSVLRSLKNLPDPPVTWAFSIPAGDPRLGANYQQPHFIQAYGFDAQTQGSYCWASYTVKNGDSLTTVSDQGFRALPNDPMYQQVGWPRQQYSTNPAARNVVLPQNIASANYQKRENVRHVLEGALPIEFADSDMDPGLVSCNSCDIVVDEENDFIYDLRPPPEISTTAEHVQPTSSSSARVADTGATITAANSAIETGRAGRARRARE